MGATKKLMEETIMAYAAAMQPRMENAGGARKGFKIVTARFANVAFSNGSLPIGWLNRIAKRQPLSCPLGIRRFFVSPVESGELCLAASVLAESGDIIYPKLDEKRDMIPFDAVVRDLLDEMGLGCRACKTTEEVLEAMRTYSPDASTGYPCEMFGSDTDGEKTFEEFYTDADVKDETTFVNLGVVKNAKRRPVAEVEAIFAKLREVFDRAGATKEDVVAALGEYLPNFHHISKGKSLDERM